jgi:hypothetical protein
MSSGQNVKLTKCQVDKMSSGHMIKAPKIDNQSFFITNLYQIPLSKFSSYLMPQSLIESYKKRRFARVS